MHTFRLLNTESPEERMTLATQERRGAIMKPSMSVKAKEWLESQPGAIQDLVNRPRAGKRAEDMR